MERRALRRRYGHARLRGEVPKRIRAAWRRGHKGTVEVGRYDDGSWFVVSNRTLHPYQVVENALGIRGALAFKLGHRPGAMIAERESA
jgi:hypothetical protein